MYTVSMDEILRNTCSEKQLVILNVLMNDLDAASQFKILREYAQDDGYFSSFAGVAQSREDSG
jgi:hypothetical protein